MSDKPAPYPADTRAKGWRFELDHERIDQSDTWTLAKPEVRPWLLMLWMTAWRQTPCGSLPHNDELIAAKIGMPLKAFEKVRAVMMRGWWLAADGLLYHKVMIERVEAMLVKRAKDAERAANNRARRSASQGSNTEVTGVSRVTPSGLRPEFDTKHQAPSTRTSGEETPKAPRKRRASAAAQQFVSVDQLVAEGVQQQHADDWLAIRAKKGLPLTSTALNQVRSEAALAGMSLPQAIKTAAENTWGGFKAKWLTEGAPVDRVGAHAMPNKQEAREQRNRAVADEWAAEGAPQ